jgi:hypothetical protein
MAACGPPLTFALSLRIERHERMGFNQVFVIFWLSAIPSGKQSKTFVPGGASEAHRSALAKRTMLFGESFAESYST